MKPPAIEVLVFALGVAVSAAAGVTAYARYGMYGDGPRGPGFSREWDAETQTYRLVHESTISMGRLRRIFDANRAVVQAELDKDGDGTPDEIIKFLDTDGTGKADRWEIYVGGRLTATLVDADEDGRPDAAGK